MTSLLKPNKEKSPPQTEAQVRIILYECFMTHLEMYYYYQPMLNIVLSFDIYIFYIYIYASVIGWLIKVECVK